jgi:hypothetical protein
MKEVKEFELNELSKGHTPLNERQLQTLLSATPDRFKYKRPAKGGGQWEYVSGTYVKKVLNFVCGWDWDFEVVDKDIFLEAKQVVVLGKLTIRVGENGEKQAITKMQYGRKDIMFRKGTTIPMDIGNDMKAATTDALKKCASEFGIASDVYGANEFKEINVKGGRSIADTDANKQKARIAKHITESEDLENLLIVEHLVDAAGARPLYNAQAAKIEANEKV